jgi:hypothetical protein
VPEAKGSQGENKDENGNEINLERAEPGPKESEWAEKMFRFGRHISDSDREVALTGGRLHRRW